MDRSTESQHCLCLIGQAITCLTCRAQLHEKITCAPGEAGAGRLITKVAVTLAAVLCIFA